MNCLVCGHKLAIFRKLSLGDFCSQEHRALFAREQGETGLARLMETSVAESRVEKPKPVVEAKSPSKIGSAGPRVYAQFLVEEMPACHEGAFYYGYGPLSAAQMIAPRAVTPSRRRLAPARTMELPDPQVDSIAPIYCEPAGLSLRLPGKRLPVWNGGANIRLRPAGLILPWSSGAGSQTAFSLAPLVAAAWAQSGYSEPIASSQLQPEALRFTWPAIQGTVEFTAPAQEILPAAFAAVEEPALQPMRVRMAMPSVASHQQKLELAMQAPAQLQDSAAPVQAATAIPATQPAKRGLFDTLFRPSPKPAPVITARARARARDREEVFRHDEPVQPRKASSMDAWRAMLSGWTPAPAALSALFAVMFLISAGAIFLSAPAALSTERTPSFRWGSLRSAIRNRAVFKVEDDFQAGLSHWIGPIQDWSYDKAGFLRPGRLGFLQQSMSLVNYRMELMGQIERKSLGWAFRAKDENNYYVAKLTVARPGPLPLVDLVRYAVTNGKEGAKVRVPLSFSVRNDTLYQVEMNVNGDQFRASVNGHVVDSWTDKLLRAGGVGFVNGQGEASRVRWIRVSDRDDFVGRVCSYLTAYSYQPSSDGALRASYYTFLRPPGL